jgi:hypothetical protein
MPVKVHIVDSRPERIAVAVFRPTWKEFLYY